MATATNSNDETIALLGATGRTGKHVLRLALEQGYAVRALVRTPGKLDPNVAMANHEKLTVIEGDITSDTARETVQETCRGATYVICCLSGPNSNTDYVEGFMTKFVGEILWPVLRQQHPKAVLFQASAFCAVHGSLPFSLKMVRSTVGRMVGILPGVRDNEGVIQFMEEHPLSSETAVIVTRPGRLEEKEEDATTTNHTLLEASQSPEMNTISFRDVAVFTLQAIKDKSLVGKYPYLKIKN